MEQLLDYFMKETNKRFDTVDDQFASIASKLEDLVKFKIQMMTSTLWTSVIVSGLCGLLTMLATVWIAVKTK